MGRRIAILLFLVALTALLGVSVGCEKLNEASKNLGLSNEEIISGLKEALSVSAKGSAESASSVGGYLNNALIRIPLPKEVQPVADLIAKTDQIPLVGSLIKSSLNEATEQFVKSMNRAAEIAAKPAGGIFLGAIKQMTIADGLSILQGSDTAATRYLRGKTYDSLATVFKPIVQESMGQAEVIKYWEKLSSNYDQLVSNPLVKVAMPTIKQHVPNLPDKLEADLPTYVTNRGLDGLFVLIRGEEQKIRKDPTAYASSIIQKVFSSPEAKKAKKS